jgi:hypothetical protein
LALPWAAERASLSGDELRKAVSGKTVYLRISGFDLPIRYSEGGSMASQLCQRWSSWMEGKTYCYKLTRRGNSVTWVRNDGRSGSARIG